jgi:hypothetical protein
VVNWMPCMDWLTSLACRCR